MSRRPAHKVAHAQCPYGQGNWADCDAASAHRWGRCKAIVDRKAGPGDCTNWAIADDGWCGTHYIAWHEKARADATKAARQLQLEQDYLAFEELKARDPWHWLKALKTSAESTRGLAGVERVERPKAVLETAPPPRLTPRKGPHRLTELA